MFLPLIGLGTEVGSNPFPGSRTTIRTPRVSSQDTLHSIDLEGSALAPCTTALASASLSASWIASSFPCAQCICLTSCMMPCTTGSTQFLSPARVTLSFKINLSASKLQVQDWTATTSQLPALKLYR